tara:strand:- start:102 stop:317 length:216 start_codon:yes stop_codon:yes gene_type:complete
MNNITDEDIYIKEQIEIASIAMANIQRVVNENNDRAVNFIIEDGEQPDPIMVWSYKEREARLKVVISRVVE